jgi:ABC-type branched-subunit amino acid transport system permease subunit
LALTVVTGATGLLSFGAAAIVLLGEEYRAALAAVRR